MQSEAARVASFKTTKQFSRRHSIQAPRDWPHPTDGTWAATPETLSEAGFYHDPYALYPDNVTCFICKEEYAEWEPEDEPHEIHIKISRKCPWALLRCALEKDKDDEGNFEFKKKVRIPNSRVLEVARLESFGGKEAIWWPHSSPTHGCNAKAMAKAGFVFTPDPREGDDTATCFYCDTSLSGWEPTDDPIIEHAKRPAGKDCAFVISLNLDAKVEKPKQRPPPKTSKRNNEIREHQPVISESEFEGEQPQTARKKSKPKPKKATTGPPKQNERPALGGLDINTPAAIPAKAIAAVVPEKQKPKTVSGRLREVFGIYQTIKRIGAGSFGEVYLGVDLVSNHQVAIKLESVEARVPLLHIEAQMYGKLRGATGVPVMKWHGTVRDCNVLVLPVLGRSLQSVLEACGCRFSLPTVLMLADQLISRVQSLHEYGMIHRDLKPDNFLIGRECWDKTIYVIDLGMAKFYRDYKGDHIPFKANRGFWGNARYASIHAHDHHEQSRRSDLEALAYILIDCLKGLPWPPVKVGPDGYDDYTPVGEAKKRISPEALCTRLPMEFATFLRYARSLAFWEKPNYDQMRNMFRNLHFSLGYNYDMPYDWVGR